MNVKATGEGTDWWAQSVKKCVYSDYVHTDRLGSTTNLTDKFGRVVGRADYNGWGEITYRDALDITSSYRRIWPQSSYTGHDWDDVLGMYHAKARFYDPDAKRFVAMDPIKGNITEPLSLVPYVYCVDNSLRYIDPTGEAAIIGEVVIYIGGTILVLTYAEWVTWVNSPAGQEAMTNATQVVINGVTYVGDGIQKFINPAPVKGETVYGNINKVSAAVVSTTVDQVVALQNSITDYFEKFDCEEELSILLEEKLRKKSK